ncbi:MAG: hypothetical protein CM1200mP40_19390 [Gammaproteobacteria bacterium]|nr:MAG: hypothetical protein CM1200mP40_19390 [Gammaproteobacteria bacterium]
MDSAGPRLMLHMDDVEKTNIVQLGSRVVIAIYLLQMKSKSSIHLNNGLEREKNGVAAIICVISVKRVKRLRETLERAESFLLLGSLFAVLLAGVAIALTAKRYSERHYDYVAILKTFGCTSAQISFIYLTIQLVLAAFAVVVGWILGWLVHQTILTFLESLLLVTLPEPGIQPYIVGSLTAFICLLAFALPPLLALRETPRYAYCGKI